MTPQWLVKPPLRMTRTWVHFHYYGSLSPRRFLVHTFRIRRLSMKPCRRNMICALIISCSRNDRSTWSNGCTARWCFSCWERVNQYYHSIPGSRPGLRHLPVVYMEISNDLEHISVPFDFVWVVVSLKVKCTWEIRTSEEMQYFIVIESLRDGGHMYTAAKHVISICIPQTKKDAVVVKMIVRRSHWYILLSASILTVN